MSTQVRTGRRSGTGPAGRGEVIGARPAGAVLVARITVQPVLVAIVYGVGADGPTIPGRPVEPLPLIAGPIPDRAGAWARPH